MQCRFTLHASLMLVVACGGQRSAPAEPVVAVTIPAPPDAGVKAPEPVAIASAAPTAPTPPPDDHDEPRHDRPQRGGGGGPFDRGAVAQAISEIDPSVCATPGGPRGRGHVTITFHPSGNVQSVHVDQPFLNTNSGACVASLYASMTIPWFSGGPVTVGKSFVVP